MKLPSFQFYPGDWMKDPELRSVSYAARGLWMDMLSLMFENDRRGYLQVNGKPVNAAQLARMTGGATDEVSHCLQELETSGVFSRTDDGTIFSRRLVRDELKRGKGTIRVQEHRKRNACVTQDVTSPPEVEEEVKIVELRNNEKPIALVLREPSPDEFVYAEYGRKVQRRDGLRAINNARKRIIAGELKREMNFDQAQEYLIVRTRLFRGSPSGCGDRYTPYPASWFNASGYMDDQSEWFKNSLPQQVGVYEKREPQEVKERTCRTCGIKFQGTNEIYCSEKCFQARLKGKDRAVQS